MSPLVYLTYRKSLNRFREFLRSPSQIISALFLLAFIGFTFYTSLVSNPPESTFRDPRELYAIIFALYTFVFVFTAKTGFINGAAIFSMADVNLLFTAPFREKSILSYGLFQQLGKSLAPGLFILYQSSSINNIYGIKVSALIPILLGYAATVFLARIISMIIYSLTCSDDRKVLTGKIIFYGITGIFIVILIINTLRLGGFSPENLVTASRETIMYFMPVSGFISLAVEKTITGEYYYTLMGIIFFLILYIISYGIFSVLKKDFYEDVLKAAEVSFSAITARKEGKAQETAPRNIKIGRTGLSKGSGAFAITQKHRTENRRSKVFLLNASSLLMIGFSFVYCFIIPNLIIPLFLLNVYTMAMSVCTGRWAKEFTYPYIYLIPEKPFKKLFCLILSDLPSMALESLLCFIPLIITKSCFLTDILSLSVARFSFGLLFIGINLLLQRLFGDSEKKLLSMVLYMVFVLLFSLPSLAVGVGLFMSLISDLSVSFIIMSIINLALSLLLIYLCRNVLEYSENNSK